MHCQTFITHNNSNLQIYCNDCFLIMVNFIENYDNQQRQNNNNNNIRENIRPIECPEYYFNNNHYPNTTVNGINFNCSSCDRNYNLNNIRNNIIATRNYINTYSV